MIINASYNMVGALKKLWKDGFEDEDSYIDFFFDNRFKPENTFVYMENNSPVSIASVLNASIYHNGAFLPAGYIYGVTTSNAYRGNGFSSAIIEHINSIYPAAFLVPATEGLFNFYEKQGFMPAFSLIEYNLYAHDLGTPRKNLKTEIVYPDEYKCIRDSHFINDGYVCWDTEAIAYALAENNFCGGYALKIEIDGKQEILLYRKDNGRLLIIETTLSLPMLYDAAFYLMKQEGVGVCCVRLAPGKTSVAARSYGLLHSNIAVKNGYCNLVLD